MKFEFDPKKSATNKEKHGIDFVESQKLWDGNYLEIPVFTDDEARWLIVGEIEEVFWTAVITKRKNDITRIISVRRSRRIERKIYEDKKETN